MRILLIAALLIIIFCLGFVIGCSITAKNEENVSVGKLHIETSDPDEPYVFLEMKGPVENLLDKDFVVLQIDTKNYISQ